MLKRNLEEGCRLCCSLDMYGLQAVRLLPYHEPRFIIMRTPQKALETLVVFSLLETAPILGKLAE